MDGSVKPPDTMSEDELLNVIQSEIDLCKDYQSNKISKQRAEAYDQYYGAPLGDEVEGRSQVVARKVSQAVDSLVPALMKPFISGDRVVECQARNAEDLEGADQATDLCNYVFLTQNNGYLLLHDGIKSGLLAKTGAYYWYWDTDSVVTEETYQGLTMDQISMLQQDDSVQIIEATQSQPQPGMQPTVDVKLRTTKNKSHVCITSIAPDELLVSPKAMTAEAGKANFIGFGTLVTHSDLREMGYSDADLDDLQEGDDDLYTADEALARRNRMAVTNNWDAHSESDQSQRRYRYYRMWIRTDFDRDGVAELREVHKISRKIMYNEPTDACQIAYWCPKLMPHEPMGLSVADDVSDQHILATTLIRQILDNIYLTNAPRMQVDDQLNAGSPTIDDLLTVRPGGLIRAKSGSVNPIVTPFTAGETFQMLEAVDQEIESRVGAFRYTQGLDPNSLQNKTATGATIVQNAAQNRIEIYARNFAELCLVPTFKGILRLMAKHQDTQLVIRLRNKFTPVDPRVWKTEYDFTVNVGLGTGSKDQQLMHLQAMGGDLVAVAHSPFAGQLLDADKVFNYVSEKAKLAGFKDPTKFINDPTTHPPPPPQPPQPPPEIIAAQIKAQGSQQEAAMKVQTDQQSEAMKMQAEHERIAFQAQLEDQRAAQEIQRQREEAAMKIASEERIHAMDIAAGHEKTRMEIEGKILVAQIAAQAQTQAASTAANAANKDLQDELPEGEEPADDPHVTAMNNLTGAFHRMADVNSMDEEIIRDKSGKAIGKRKVPPQTIQ